ncbi:MAG: oxygen-independent coproporphyrinogen-3 oxidase, partial [Chlamydiales bacterium]
QKLFDHIKQSFSIDFSSEVAMEIDPRTVSADQGKKLRFLKDLGFNRVSFGVQDTNEKVQEAIKRRQSYEQSRDTLLMARDMGYKSINLDLIYGLPFQTIESFDETTDKILEMRPSRIAMYSFARTPWLKPHQKAIKEENLPSTEDKFRIYTAARKKLIEAGYLAIGMDHFVLRNDDMAKAFFRKKLQRNFQGYSIKFAEHLIGFGVSSTGFVENAYFQNVKSLDEYYDCISQNILPIFKGKILNDDDIVRQWVISSLMCEFEVRKEEFQNKFHKSFDETFSEELLTLQNTEFTELVTNHETTLSPTPQGKLFIRNIAAVFDAYLKKPSTEPRFSNAV